MCLIAIARLRSCGPRAALLLIVQPSSERTLDPVRRDNSFPEKQESHHARLLVVRVDSELRIGPRYRSCLCGAAVDDRDCGS